MATRSKPCIILDPPNQLSFKKDFLNVVTSPMVISNPTRRRISFKLRTTAPNRYTVRPNGGFIGPKSSVAVQVSLQPIEVFKLKFNIQTTAVAGSATNVTQSLSAAGKDNIAEKKLDCVFQTQEVSSGKGKAATVKDGSKTAGYKGELVFEPSETLTFPELLTEIVSSDLKISNPTNQRVCFRVQTNHPTSSGVRPNMGFIEPNDHTEIKMKMKPFRFNDNFSFDKHKFMIQSVYAMTGNEDPWKGVSQDRISINKFSCAFELPADVAANISQLSTDTQIASAQHVEISRTLTLDGESIRESENISTPGPQHTVLQRTVPQAPGPQPLGPQHPVSQHPAPQPTAPQPTLPQPTIPQPTGAQPTAPQPRESQPSAPQLPGPQPLRPQHPEPQHPEPELPRPQRPLPQLPDPQFPGMRDNRVDNRVENRVDNRVAALDDRLTAPTSNPGPHLQTQSSGVNISSKENTDIGGPKDTPLDRSRRVRDIDLCKVRDIDLCKVCKCADVRVVFLPCRHFVCCKNCAGSVGKCPICRQRVYDSMNVFRSRSKFKIKNKEFKLCDISSRFAITSDLIPN